MKIEQIIALANAGFTKDDILKMAQPTVPTQPMTAVPAQQVPTQPMASVPAVPAQQVPAQTIPGRPVNQADATTPLLNIIDQLQKQNLALASGGTTKEETSEDILLSMLGETGGENK